MKKQNEIILDVLDRIDEDILDEATDSRITLSAHVKISAQKPAGRKKWMAVAGMAACFILVCAALLAIRFMGADPVGPGVDPGTDTGIHTGGDTVDPDLADVPIYRGMSVSGEVNGGQLSRNTPALQPLSSVTAPRLVPLAKNDLTVEGTDSAIYYTRPNHDIYITIHIDNPKQYEILSFTLNGVKYQSYMIEPESTSEKLILKVNVGDVEGLVEYTIDAIKYVDGKKIEDVRMEGDKTVKVGVYTENQPKVTFSNETLDYFSMSWDITVTDELNLIAISGGEVYATLTEEFGTEELARQKLDMSGTTTFSCDGLVAGKAYRRQIIAYYDSLDGKGFAEHVIAEQIICTKGYVTFSTIGTTEKKDAVTFDLDIPTDKKVSIEKIELITDGGAVAQAGDASIREFTRVLPGRYKVVVTYTYDLGDGQGTRPGFAESIYYELDMNILRIVNGGQLLLRQSLSFSDPVNGNCHQGVDIGSSDGDDRVYALYDGTVEWKNDDAVCIISLDGKYSTAYFNLKDVRIEAGQTVRAGDVIGTAGATGHCPLGGGAHDVPFIHIYFFVNGISTDPITWKEADYG